VKPVAQQDQPPQGGTPGQPPQGQQPASPPKSAQG
jgi:hypothetical protein